MFISIHPNWYIADVVQYILLETKSILKFHLSANFPCRIEYWMHKKNFFFYITWFITTAHVPAHIYFQYFF